MRIKRTDNPSGLIDIRIAYLREDFPEMTEEIAVKIRSELKEYIKGHLERDFFAYVAEENGTLLGSAFLVINEMPPNPNFPKGRTGTVLNVYVVPESRRKGIASKIMSLLISDAESMNLDYIELKASDEGYPLYKKLGFEESISSFRPMKLITNKAL